MADTAPIFQIEADRIAAFVDHVENLDAVDLSNLASGGISTKVVDFGFVSYVQSYADSGTTVIDGSTLTMQGFIEIHMNDHSVISMDVVVTGCDTGGQLRLTDVRSTATAIA